MKMSLRVCYLSSVCRAGDRTIVSGEQMLYTQSGEKRWESERRRECEESSPSDLLDVEKTEENIPRFEMLNTSETLGAHKAHAMDEGKNSTD